MRILVVTAMLLAPLSLPAQVQVQDAAAKGKAQAAYQSLVEQYSEARLEYRRAGSELSREERAALEQPVVSFLPHFQEAAKQYAGTEGSVPFLAWIVMNGTRDKEAVTAALDTLVSKHIASPGWASIAPRLSSLGRVIGEGRAAKITATVLANNSSPEVKSQILFARASTVFRNLSRGTEEVSKKDAEMAKADMRKVMELATDEMIVTRAKGTLFEV